MPIASILIPVYNREKIIEETIASSLSQTIYDIEVIIVDNQSTDNTYELCQNYSQRDKRIRVYQNEKNIGPVLNWIRCAYLATAPYSKILFSDDLIASNYLEKTLPYIISPDCALVYTPAIIGKEEWKGDVYYQPYLSDCKMNNMFFINTATFLPQFIPVSPCAALFRTDDLRTNILTTLPGITDYDFTRYGAGVDWLVYMLTAANYGHVAYVSDPLVFFRHHNDSITIRNENNMVNLGYMHAVNWFKTQLAKSS